MRTIDPRRVRHALYVAVAVAFAALVFYVFGKDLGDGAAVVSVVPVALVASFFGSRAGLVATALAFPFNTFVLDYLAGIRNNEGAVTQTRALITLSLVVVSFAFGRYYLLVKKVDELERGDRNTEGSLLRSEHRLRAFLAATPDPIFRISRTGRLLEVHGATGQSERSNYLYRNLSEFLPAEFATCLVSGIQTALDTGKIQFVIGEADLGEGLRSYEVRLSPAGSEAVGILRDITLQQQAEQQQKRGDMVTAQDEFVASIAHELRTPLSAVIGFSHELRDHRGTFSDMEQAELMDMIADQAGLLMYRIEDLIVAARAEVDRLEFSMERFDLNALTREVLGSLPENRVRVIGETTYANGDRGRSGQVIRNLIGNTIAHSTGDIFVTVDSTAQQFLVSVHDAGSGAGLGDPEAMFERYKTDAQAETQPDRLGLSLVVARRLARLMGGDVTYARKNGLSSFVFSLPKTP